MKTYSVIKVFKTLQGEGLDTGTPYVFVRLARCNAWSGHPKDRDRSPIACAKWCDTDFVTGAKNMQSDEIVARVRELAGSSIRHVVFTGGEPLLQLDAELVSRLQFWGFKVAIETNGSLPLSKDLVALHPFVTVSPKVGFKDGIRTFENGHVTFSQIKAVVPQEPSWSDERAEEWLRAFEALTFNWWFVMPCDEIDPAFVEVSRLRNGAPSHNTQRWTKFCVDFVQRRFKWRLTYQTHKLWGIE